MTRLFRLRDAKKFRADGIDANWSHCARRCKRLSSTDWRDDDWPAKTVERAGGNPPDRADHPASLRDRRGRAEGRARKAYPAAYPAWASAPRTETISRRTQITTGKERGRDARGESRIAPGFSQTWICSAGNAISFAHSKVATVSPRSHVAEASRLRHGWFIAL